MVEQNEDLSVFVGGSPWLDLANTIYQSENQQADLLLHKGGVFHLVRACGLQTRELEIELLSEERMNFLTSELRSLRDIIYHILEQLFQCKTVTADVANILEQYFSRFQLKSQVFLVLNKPIIRYHCSSPIDNLLYQIALSIIETLHEYSVDRIRQCEHVACILYFVDTSKAGRRRWCSMESCGNRSKAAAFYARKKGKHDEW